MAPPPRLILGVGDARDSEAAALERLGAAAGAGGADFALPEWEIALRPGKAGLAIARVRADAAELRESGLPVRELADKREPDRAFGAVVTEPHSGVRVQVRFGDARPSAHAGGRLLLPVADMDEAAASWAKLGFSARGRPFGHALEMRDADGVALLLFHRDRAERGPDRVPATAPGPAIQVARIPRPASSVRRTHSALLPASRVTVVAVDGPSWSRAALGVAAVVVLVWQVWLGGSG